MTSPGMLAKAVTKKAICHCQIMLDSSSSPSNAPVMRGAKNPLIPATVFEMANMTPP